MDNKRLFLEIQKHLMEDSIPSQYFKKLIEEQSLTNTSLSILEKLKPIKQDSSCNYKDNVLVHTLKVIDEAAKVRDTANNKEAFMWAALLHDIGKEKAPINNNSRIFYENHNRIGAEMTRRILRDFTENKEFIEYVINLIKYHRTCSYVIKRISLGDTSSMIKTANLHDVALLCLCNNLNKEPITNDTKYKILDNINTFLSIMSSRTGVYYHKLDIIF